MSSHLSASAGLHEFLHRENNSGLVSIGSGGTAWGGDYRVCFLLKNTQP